MKRVFSLLAIASLFAARAAAHTTVVPHSHPHSEQAGDLNSALAIGALSIVAALAWYATRQAARKNASPQR